jgi:glycine dehydrogenase subunit 1
MALVATINLATHGREGLKEMATHNLAKARHLRRVLVDADFEPVFDDAPWFNEFVVRSPKQSKPLHRQLMERGYLLGLDLSRWYPELEGALLVACTEAIRREDLDRFEATLKEVL